MSWPHPAAEVLALAAPELSRELRDPATWRPVAHLKAADVVLVAAWAVYAPDPRAERLRLEHRVHRRDAGQVSRPRFLPRWLCDPIAWTERRSAAGRWSEQGQPPALDVLGPEDEEVGRVEATRLDQLQRAADLWDTAKSDETRERARYWYRLLEALDPAPAPRGPRPGSSGGWGAVGDILGPDGGVR